LSNTAVTNAWGWEPSDDYQLVTYGTTGQTMQNFIERKRGTMAIDGSLSEYYGIEHGRLFLVEVKLRSYHQRRVSFEDFFKGMLPGGTNNAIRRIWNAEIATPLLTFNQYWGKATGAAASGNLTTDAARAAYIAELKNDPDAVELMETYGNDYLWFDIMQIVKVPDELGWDFESGQGKGNGVDVNHDGYMDKDPNGNVIFVPASSGNSFTPTSTFGLNWNDEWWIGYTGPINADGTPYSP
jgi:hypothetical protein